MNRRKFITGTLTLGTGLTFMNSVQASGLFTNSISVPTLQISLAQWSLHRKIRSGKMNHLEFAEKSQSFGCVGLEYVSVFFKDKAKNKTFLKEMNTRAEDHQQQNVLIMVDGEGYMADKDSKKRTKAIENHYKWVEAANTLGCHAIRVNLAGQEDKIEAQKAGVDSLNRLGEFAKPHNISILVENHNGLSSDCRWLSDVMQNVKYKNIGTLPDFGNFCVKRGEDGSCITEYDKYQGISELMPFAKALSAKSYEFDAAGNETKADFYKMLTIARENDYSGYVGIEFEGNTISEEEGIIKTKNLLDKAISKIY